MNIVIITVAGISSRFNKDIIPEQKILKCLYYENNPKNTLIYKMIEKVCHFDKIIIVGGYKFLDLADYVQKYIPLSLKEKITLIDNKHFYDLNSGYSLYLGIKESLDNYDDVNEILFVEGDLDIDNESFSRIINSNKNVLTFNYEPIYSNKAVVLYQNENDEYKYIFNSDHELLSIKEPFKAIFNSGQSWKFKEMDLLKIANDNFYEKVVDGTNLEIIQKYFDLLENDDEIEIIGLKHWVNCNTREDYKLIKNYWEE